MVKNAMNGAVELRTVLDRFSALSECALRACDSGDGTGLAAALDARDLLAGRLASLTRDIAAARRAAATPAIERDLDAMIAPLQDAVRDATRINQRLAERASDVRAQVVRQLERLNQDNAAVTAYASASPLGTVPRLDRTR